MIFLKIYCFLIFSLLSLVVIYKISNLFPYSLFTKWVERHLIKRIDDKIICDSYDRFRNHSILDDESTKK